MNLQQMTTAIPYVIGGLFALGLVLFVLALHQLRRGRIGPYWRARRQASTRGGRLLLTSLTLLTLAIALAFYSGLAAIAFRGLFAQTSEESFQGVVVPTFSRTPFVRPTNTPTATPTSTATPTMTRTLPPSATATATLTATQTLTPTITSTPTATLTPSATFEQVVNLTLPAGREAQANASVQITAADQTLSLNQTPIEPKTVFSAGLKRVYLFINFQHMDNGVAWSRVLYREGVPVQGQSYLWSMGDTGTSFFFFGNDEGYASGDYEVRLYLGETEVNRFAFRVA